MGETISKISYLAEGIFAPDFALNTDTKGTVVLSELKGKNVVLYFYPKDDTSGCTTEAIDFTGLLKSFEVNNTIVIGVSKDTIEKHQKFREKHNLSVILASDVEGTVCEAYDTWVEKSMYGKTYMGISRDTFLIDKEGMIQKIWRKAKVKNHAETVLEAVKTLD